jgi:DNA-binding response OmpR family regulator
MGTGGAVLEEVTIMRVLIVDDEQGVRDTVSHALKRAGHEAVAVANGRAGMSAIEAGGFDAVVTDICMPERDGIELIRTLRAADPPLPVLAISGGGAYGVDGLLKMAELLGARATLRKPFAPSELVAAVEAISAA